MSPDQTQRKEADMENDIQAVRALLDTRCTRLFEHANVVATGVGYKVTAGKRTGTLSIICSVRQKQAVDALAQSDRIPASVDGIATDVIQTGVLRAWQSHTSRQRPAPGGISIGHKDITAGTLGCLVRKNGQVMILSNNHVLANSNAAGLGDAILQPGPYDGGKFPQDHIAALQEFVPLIFSGSAPPSDCSIGNSVAALLNGVASLLGSRTRLQAVRPQAGTNLVDAAIARPLNAADVSSDLLEIGAITGQARGELDMAVKKSGRTTGLTQGIITQVDVTSDVQYGPGQIARFTDQLMAGNMSQGGDSGSAVLDGDNRLVGLLFAGGDNTTLFNRIEHVFSALGVSL
jgi:hypothetical protein